VQQFDSKIIVGGTFTQIGGLPNTAIARLLANGAADSSFKLNAYESFGTGYVYDVIIQSDKRIIIVGDFDRVGSTPSLQDTLVRERAAGIWYPI
jgi:hypothetical protein